MVTLQWSSIPSIGELEKLLHCSHFMCYRNWDKLSLMATWLVCRLNLCLALRVWLANCHVGKQDQFIQVHSHMSTMLVPKGVVLFSYFDYLRGKFWFPLSPVERDIEYSGEWSSGWRLACIASIPKEPNEIRQCKKVFFFIQATQKMGWEQSGPCKRWGKSKENKNHGVQ